MKPLTGQIAESVWNGDEKVKPKDKDLQHKIFNDDDTLIGQFLKEPPLPPEKEKKIG